MLICSWIYLGGIWPPALIGCPMGVTPWISFSSVAGSNTRNARTSLFFDLGLPRISGYEALKAIKKDAAYSDIPIVVLTTSCDPLDQRQCMDLGANAFFSKPRNLQGYHQLAEQLTKCDIPRLIEGGAAV
jgi:FOG: CheY-like receiver